ncbi:hypothetical protein B0T20DRAFT_12193 [Sordaria brevicollis]|uniref:Uncharacterized protein n=1 Tax=Sordaria brevicollis TaxID=83679 RepID=A0AAE0UG38_SORBR|nr:hypothetical protein B0T20DRAFT_12193 [Sordaria brevicollis]
MMASRFIHGSYEWGNKNKRRHGPGKLMTTYTGGNRLPIDDKQTNRFRGWHRLEECVYISHDTNGRTRRSCMTGFLFGLAKPSFPALYRRENHGWEATGYFKPVRQPGIFGVALGLSGLAVMWMGLERVRLEGPSGFFLFFYSFLPLSYTFLHLVIPFPPCILHARTEGSKPMDESEHDKQASPERDDAEQTSRDLNLHRKHNVIVIVQQ